MSKYSIARCHDSIVQSGTVAGSSSDTLLLYSLAKPDSRTKNIASSPGHSQILSRSCLRDKIWEWPRDEAMKNKGLALQDYSYNLHELPRYISKAVISLQKLYEQVPWGKNEISRLSCGHEI